MSKRHHTTTQLLSAAIAAISMALLLLISACQSSESNSDNHQMDAESKPESNAWVEEELLLQMKAVRSELAELKRQVQEMNSKLDNNAKPDEGQKQRLPAPTNSIHFDERAVIGDPDAKIAIVEYTDYQCPYCARHHSQVFPEIKQKLIDTGKVQYLVRNYPLDFHPQAHGAAVAAYCADQQGAILDMHSYLFEHSRNLSKETYLEGAKSLGLEVGNYTKCLGDKAAAEVVDTDILYGQQVGVSGTPKFFVGLIEGNRILRVRSISGAQSYTAFERVIRSLSGPKAQK